MAATSAPLTSPGEAAHSSYPSGLALILVTLLLFGVWSNSFIAIEYLLGTPTSPGAFDWLALLNVRFALVAVICTLYVALFRGRETLAILRAHWRRLIFSAIFCVWGYNSLLYYGQQAGVPAPIASLETALAPLFLMLLAACFLGERLSKRKLLGFVVALAGVTMIALAKGGLDSAYPLIVALTAGAPLSWAIFSIITKPISHKVDSTLWSYLVVIIGGLPLIALLPLSGGEQLLAIDAAGAGAMAFLVLPCTVLGFALWAWLLKYMPASSVGFTVFLNPPMTTSFKAIYALILPAIFSFEVVNQEMLGGALALTGLAIAVVRRSSVKRARLED